MLNNKISKQSFKRICIIDSLEAYEKCLKYRPDAIVTDNFLLYKKIKCDCKLPIIITETYISQFDIDTFGKKIIEWGIELDKNLNRLAKSNILEGSIQEVSSFSMFFLSLICRTEGLKRSIDLKNVDEIIIISNYNELWSESSKHKRFISPYILLAKNNFFGKAKIIVNELKNNFMGSVNVSSTDSWLLRVLSASLIVNFTWKIFNTKIFAKKFSQIIVKDDSEIIREFITKMFFKGLIPTNYESLLPVSKNKIKNIDREKYDVSFNYKDFMKTFLSNKLNKYFDYDENQTKALISTAVSDMKKKLVISLIDISKTDDFFNKHILKYKKIKCIVVSAPNGTAAKYFHKMAKKNNILILNFEHGLTTGISSRNKYYMPFSEATNCDHMFVSNHLAKDDYQLNKKIAKIYPVGIANQCRNIPYRKFQRVLNRKKFNLTSKDFCICHVSTLLLNGAIRYGPNTPRDEDVVNFNNIIIKNVYNEVTNKKIIFKDYPSKRFIFQPSLKDRIKEKKKHIEFEEEGDWRYIRASADLIVTMSPTSTLSWCLGADVPLVWLELPWVPLRHDWLVEHFRKAFFSFDIKDKNWTIKLKNFLSLHHKEINKRWLEKKEHRDILLKQHLFGEDRAAELSADIASKLIN